MSSLAVERPRLRGVLHVWAFGWSLVLGGALLAFADRPGSAVALGLYAVTVSSAFGVSALYHRRSWSPRGRRWMRRLDHSMIFLLIAGSYTPFAVVAMRGTLAAVLLAVLWTGAVLGVLVTVLWIDAPRWLVVALCAALGWAAAAALPSLVSSLGFGALALVGAGGLLYTAGAVVYGLRRPDPVPAVFGFHEVFHLLVVLAAATHYAAVLLYVVPRA